ncbi:hypothetical protein N8810_00615 [Flavobacteriaceae bacterium]|nr:hypothetical protein [Flavobacteriaceae bacterium]
MRKLIFILLSFISFSMFGQGENEIGEILVKKDSVSFYSFGKNGVYEFTILPSKKLKKTYNAYSSPLPSELKAMPFDALSSLVYNENEVYFLYPGGGLLFKYKDGTIKRVDASFAHRNQFSGYFFKYKNEIYLLGGYGYWKSKSLLTKFNFETKNWDYVTTIGQNPVSGINAGSFVQEKNRLYVFDFYSKAPDDNDIQNNNLYMLDLDNFSWEKQGLINNMLSNSVLRKSFGVKVAFKNSLIRKSVDENIIKIITPSENIIKFFSVENLPGISRDAIVVGSNIVYPLLSADRQYLTLAVKNLEENLTLLNEGYFTNDFGLFKNYFIYVALFCGLLIFLTFIKFKKEKFVFFISENNLSGMNQSIQISKDEKFIVQLISLSKNKKVDNSLILNYFKNNTISLDASVKRKNKVVDELNRKFLDNFKLVLILKSVKKSDSRQAVYSLNPVIDI